MSQFLAQFDCQSPIMEDYKCHECQFTTPYAAYFHHHLQQPHKKEKTVLNYICQNYSYQTSSPLLWLKHEKTCANSLCPNQRKSEVRALQCAQCPYKTKHMKRFKTHFMVKHSADSEKIWQRCGFCAFKTLHRASLAMHLKVKHPSDDVQLFQCTLCDFKSRYKHSLERHVFLKHGKLNRFSIYLSKMKRGKVGKTGKIEYKSGDLEKFRRISGNVHRCKQCPYFSKSAFFLQNHLRRHSTLTKFDCQRNTVEPFSCSVCCFTTHFITYFAQHLKNCHKTENNFELRNYKCQACPLQTNSLFLWYMHKRHFCIVRQTPQEFELYYQIDNFEFDVATPHSKWFVCDHCSYKTIYEYRLRDHMDTKHAGLTTPVWFQCNQCNFRGKTKQILQNHSDLSHKWFNCPHCESKFRRRDHLKNHINYLHTADDEAKWYKCEHCEHKTKKSDHLKRHVIAKHAAPEDIKWFECDQCDYKGKNKSHFNRHVVRHESEERGRWFKCEQCEYKVRQKGALKSHVLRRHTEEKDLKWFECAKCEYKAKQKCDLKKHVLAKHVSVVFK